MQSVREEGLQNSKVSVNSVCHILLYNALLLYVDKDRVEPIYDLPFSEAKNKLTTEENEAYDTTGDNTMQRNRAYSTSVNIHHLKSLQRSSAASS